ncbi:MAG: hypothetical protein JO127_13415 [Caulobacteraceae bacterium]|nr:hypothetical protein [Caulobacteraceae bacterium]
MTGAITSESAPGPSQSTNLRIRARMVEALKSVGAIDILTASPPDAAWNGWPINAAAGLEIGLIANYDIPWNVRGRPGGSSAGSAAEE